MSRHGFNSLLNALSLGIEIVSAVRPRENEFNLSSGIFSEIFSILYDPPGYAFLNC